MKITHLPYEILLEIFHYLDPKDKFNCLTVCKHWHPSVEDSVCIKARISSWERFIMFANKLKHHKLALGSKVNTLKLTNTKKWDLFRDERQVIATSKMDILKRYCVNLKELDFDTTDFFWEYLKSVNWKNSWPQLVKIPPYNDDLAMYTYSALSHRITSTTFVWPGKVTKEMMDILLTMKQLESLTLDQNNMLHISVIPDQDGGFRWGPELATIHDRRPFSIHFLKQILGSLQNLKHLNIKCMIRNIFSESAVLPPLTCLESFSCNILHSDSAWFPIIKANFANMPHLNLTMVLSTIKNYDTNSTYPHQIAELYEHLNVKKVTLSFNSENRALRINDFMRGIIRKTDLIEPVISVSLDIYDKETLSSNIKEKYKITSIRKGNRNAEKNTIHHDIKIQAVLDTNEVNELGHVGDMIGITYYDSGGEMDYSLNHLVELRLNRVILEHGQSYSVDLDKLLFKLPHLQYLTLSSKNRIVSNQAPITLEGTLFLHPRQVQSENQEGYYYQLKNSFRNFLKGDHQHLKSLDLEHICIDVFVFNLILSKCPELKYLNITDCVVYQDSMYKKIDQETLPHIWFECLHKNITVCIK